MSSPSDKQDQYDQNELDRMVDEGGPLPAVLTTQRAMVSAFFKEAVDTQGEQPNPNREDEQVEAEES